MKLKIVFLFASLLFISLSTLAQTNVPSFRITGQKLSLLFSSFDTLEITTSAPDPVTHNITVTFFGYSGGIPHIINSGIGSAMTFIIQSPAKPVLPFLNTSSIRCYGHPIDFIPITTAGKNYYLVPSRIINVATGKFYISFRFKDVDDVNASYYKAMNPIPPGTSAALLF